MDCDFPDTDGYALTALFRRMEAETGRAPCPIIAISASRGTEHENRCFDAGMDGILSKPIRMGKLQDTMELWCGVVLEQAPGIGSDRISKILSAEQIVDSLRQDLRIILEASALRDAEGALRAAHRLRGAALAMELTEVASVAEEIENRLKHEPDWLSQEWNDVLHRMAQTFEESQAELRPSA